MQTNYILASLGNQSWNNVSLKASYDGKIYLSFPEKDYELVYNELLLIDSEYYVSAYVDRAANRSAKMLYKVSFLTQDFFDYWDDDRLKDLVKQKLDNFIGFWVYTLYFIKNNPLVAYEGIKYKIYPSDYTDVGGNFSINFDVHFGSDFYDDDRLFELEDAWLDGYLDREYDVLDVIRVNFLP